MNFKVGDRVFDKKTHKRGTVVEVRVLGPNFTGIGVEQDPPKDHLGNLIIYPYSHAYNRSNLGHLRKKKRKGHNHVKDILDKMPYLSLRESLEQSKGKAKKHDPDTLKPLINNLEKEMWGVLKYSQKDLEEKAKSGCSTSGLLAGMKGIAFDHTAAPVPRRVWVLYPKSTPNRPYDVTESFEKSREYMLEYKDFNRYEFIELTPEVKERLGIL